MEDPVDNQKMLAAIRQRALKKKKARQVKSAEPEDASLVTNISTPKDKKSKNKNKDKVLQTETFKNKAPRVLEVIPKSKSSPAAFDKTDKKDKKFKKDKKKSKVESSEENSIQEPIKPAKAEKTNLEKRTLEKMLKGNEDTTFIEFDEADDLQQTQPSYLVKAGEGESIDDMFRKLKKVKNEEGDSEQKSAREVYKGSSRKTKEVVIDEEDEKKMAPWMSNATSKIENTTLRLHNEIMDFVEYIGPSKKEDALRKKSFEKLVETIRKDIPGATVKPFGSFVTNLYLPQSDIDIAVIEPTFGAQTLLGKVAKIFMKHQDYECVNVIRSAKVPLVKIVERSTGLNFDISFNKMDGINQIQEIQRALDYYPEMRYLIILIKCFLKQRDLNETFQGGIGSFLLFCLVLAFLREVRNTYKEHEREEEVDKILLSEFILKFFDFFGNFDVARNQILIADGGGIVKKYVRDWGFSVLSPQDSSHDIGKAVFRVREVFGIFKNRYHFMVNYNFKQGESVLKYMINSYHL